MFSNDGACVLIVVSALAADSFVGNSSQADFPVAGAEMVGKAWVGSIVCSMLWASIFMSYPVMFGNGPS